MVYTECEICKTEKPNDEVFLLIGKDNKTTIKACVDCLKSLIDSYEREKFDKEIDKMEKSIGQK
jgi:hypothetical protein